MRRRVRRYRGWGSSVGPDGASEQLRILADRRLAQGDEPFTLCRPDLDQPLDPLDYLLSGEGLDVRGIETHQLGGAEAGVGPDHQGRHADAGERDGGMEPADEPGLRAGRDACVVLDRFRAEARQVRSELPGRLALRLAVRDEDDVVPLPQDVERVPHHAHPARRADALAPILFGAATPEIDEQVAVAVPPDPGRDRLEPASASKGDAGEERPLEPEQAANARGDGVADGDDAASLHRRPTGRRLLGPK